MKKMLSSALIVFAFVPFLYIGVPLLHLLWQTTGEGMGNLTSNRDLLSAFGTSVLSATLTTLFALVFGLPAAFFLATKDFFGKRLVEVLLLLPLVMPPIVGGIAQMDLYGPQTWIGGWFMTHGLNLTNSLAGVVLAQAFITSPFLIFSAKVGFEEIPKELGESTRILGGTWTDQFIFVTLPLARQAILTGALLTFTRALGEFGATMIMAYHPYTVPVDIWVEFTSGGLEQIIPIASVIVLLALLVAGLSSFKWVNPRPRAKS